MAAKRNATNGDIYSLVDTRVTNLRLENKGDIKDLSDKIDAFYKDLSTKIDNLNTKQAVSSTKLGMLITGIAVISSGATTVIISILARKPL